MRCALDSICTDSTTDPYIEPLLEGGIKGGLDLRRFEELDTSQEVKVE